MNAPDEPACGRCGGTAQTGPGLVGCICESFWTPPASCGMLRRWWHRRQRAADLRFMIPLLVGSVSEEGTDDQERRRLALTAFLVQRGQEHWHCACGIPERTQLMERL